MIEMEIIENIEGYKDIKKPIFIAGGPMMGSSLPNDNLIVTYCAAGTWGSRIYANTSSSHSNDVSIDLSVKSGSFGTGKIDLTSYIDSDDIENLNTLLSKLVLYKLKKSSSIV